MKEGWDEVRWINIVRRDSPCCPEPEGDDPPHPEHDFQQTMNPEISVCDWCGNATPSDESVEVVP